MCDKFVQDANDCHQMLSHRMQSDGPRTKSGPHMYFISSMLFFKLNYLPIWKGSRIHIKLWFLLFPLGKKNKNKSCSSTGPTIPNMATFNWCGCSNSHGCLFPHYSPSPACFHYETENSLFAIPHLPALFSFLQLACLTCLFYLMGYLYTTNVLNCPTNVIVRFPSSGWEWMHKCSNWWPYLCCSKPTDWL